MAGWWTNYIRRRAGRYGVDPRAAIAVARMEGLSGGVGDAGTSFGPFQLHVGGALPRDKGRAWAESRAGIDYALRTMSNSGARGLTGRAAIEAIVRKFERPANPDKEVRGAWDWYSSGAKFPGGGAHSPLSNSNDPSGGLGQPGSGDFNKEAARFLMSRASARARGEEPRTSLIDLARQRAELIASDNMSAELSGTPMYGAPSGPGITYSGEKFTHQTSGLAGYPAIDQFAKPGTSFNAPEDGTIIRHSGRGGTSGQVYGYSVYFKGKSGKTYFITHLGPNRAPVGSRLKRGQRIGRVSPWSGGSPHAHVGVH